MSDRPWLASYGKHIPADIDADAYPSVVHLMDAAIARYRDRIAFRSAGNALSYREFDAKARALAAFLQQRLGVKKGDRIAVMMPNLLAFPIAMLGIARAGAVQVNVNPLYTPRELEHQLNDAGVETIIVFNGSTPTLAETAGKTGIKTVITVARVTAARPGCPARRWTRAWAARPLSPMHWSRARRCRSHRSN